MTFNKVYLLPLAVFVIFPGTFLTTYIAAVLNGHVEPGFPYISDSGTYSPESCFFGELLVIGTFVLTGVIYIRYCQVEEYHRCFMMSPAIQKVNRISIWFGFTSCLGLTIVANFQETNVFEIHIFGAFLCFGMGTVYFWLQAICSYYLHPIAHSIAIAHIRLGLSVVCTVFYIIVGITGVVAHSLFHGTNARKWYPSDGGFLLHVISTASEWVVAIAFCGYILTFAREFRSISLEPPRVTLNLDRSPPEASPVLTPAAGPERPVDIAPGRPVPTARGQPVVTARGRPGVT